MVRQETEKAYQQGYSAGYKEAAEEKTLRLRRSLQQCYRQASTDFPDAYSYNAGWNAAVDRVVTELLKL